MRERESERERERERERWILERKKEGFYPTDLLGSAQAL